MAADYCTRGGTRQLHTKGRAEMLNAFLRPQLLLHYKPHDQASYGFLFEGNIGVSGGLRVQSQLAYWHDDLGQMINPGTWVSLL